MSLKSLFVSLAVVVSALFVSSPDVFAQTSSSVTLTWSPSPGADIAGYVVYSGTASKVYTSVTRVGNQTSATIGSLQAGQSYFFAVTALNSLGLESPPSNEVIYQVPLSPTSPPTVSLTLPVAGAAYTTPIDIGLAASTTANGHTLNKVQFFADTTLLGESAAAPYTFTWKNVSAGTYSLTAQLTYDSGSTVVSSPVSISVTSLPIAWQIANVGTLGVNGSVAVTNGTYTVKGAGSFGGSADNLSVVYQSLSGDGEIVARVTSVEPTGSSARIGLMIRESLTSGARCAFMGISPDGSLYWLRRNRTGGKLSTSTPGTGTPPNLWVRLVRTGNTIAAYSSIDGSTWISAGSQNISMASNIYFGLVVTSGSVNSLNTATFSNVSVVP